MMYYTKNIPIAIAPSSIFVEIFVKPFNHNLTMCDSA